MNSILICGGDLTKKKADAIVCPAREDLAPWRGICASIFRAAGEEELADACRVIGHCDTGNAVLTDGFALAKYIIHAAGPVWKDGRHGEPQLLYQCCQRALDLALENGVHTIGFPLRSTGPLGCPDAKALRQGLQALNDWLWQHPEADMQVILVVRGKEKLADAKKELVRQQKEHRLKDRKNRPDSFRTETCGHARYDDWDGNHEMPPFTSHDVPEESDRTSTEQSHLSGEDSSGYCVNTEVAIASFYRQGQKDPQSLRDAILLDLMMGHKALLYCDAWCRHSTGEKTVIPMFQDGPGRGWMLASTSPAVRWDFLVLQCISSSK